ncbi:sugar porter family MFS transporter [Bartonella tamiae]|uniref:Sugar porter (SP) family MFS transporter n=1 Tax=Bartonella tamiae Th239 TaxID=1094558 RepID=J0QWG0_9HYPH|nr:sugar porter family MFS transporter [Bartonella tamiae]EJF90371.1 sugar porter (SP) family MFS transporter [Bartonella tamiae Th239]EJF93685.1 sugar porter (SP) family MFS transporter [Bartonella tamiae Th307]
MQSRTHSTKRTIVFICFLAALAGLLFGLDTGVISGALPFLSQEFGLSEVVEGRVVSSLMLGAAFGAIFAGWLSFYIGRKYSLIIAATLFVLGSLVCALSPSVEVLIIARVALGVAIGIASYAAPLYLSEIAPEKIRGSMISFYQLLITVGILAAYLSNTAFSYWEAWRWMLGVIAIPAALMFLGALVLPRSPRWLASKGRLKEAERVLDGIRETQEEAKNELTEIVDSLKIKQSGWLLFKHNANFRRSVGLGVVLQIMQQFTGINIILYFAPRIIEIAGFTSTTQQMWGTVIVGLVNVFATFIAMGVVDSWGRRKTLVLGFSVMAIGMGVLSLMLGMGSTTVWAQYFAIFVLLIFIVGFAMSAGPLVWVLCSEIQPLKGRDFGITVSTATNWFANMAIATPFLYMISNWGGSITFLLFAIMNAIFIGITLWLVPETKNISLENIEANLMSGKKLRQIGQPVQ